MPLRSAHSWLSVLFLATRKLCQIRCLSSKHHPRTVIRSQNPSSCQRGFLRPQCRRACAPDTPHIGDLIECEVSVEHGSDFSVQINVPGSWEGEAQLPAQRASDRELLVSKRILTTRWLSMRKLKLHGFRAQWRHRDGATGELTLPDEFVAMNSVMANVPDPEFRFFRSSEEKVQSFWSRHGGLPFSRPIGCSSFWWYQR